MSDQPAVITPRVASILLRHLDARRLRVQFRNDPDVYAVLLALAESAVNWEMAGAGQELAIDGEAGHDRLMTVLQAARISRVSARTIIRAIDEGELDAHKLGPVWAISDRSLQRWIARRERQEKRAS